MISSTLTTPGHLNSDRFAIRNAVTAIRNSYLRIDGRLLLIGGGAERRSSVRVGLRVPVRINMAHVDHGEVIPHTGESSVFEATCHDISLGGFGLTHASRLPFEFAVVRFDIPADDPVCLAVELVWSNRTDNGSWISGARIMGLTNQLEN